MTDIEPQIDSRYGRPWYRVRDKQTGHHYSVSTVDPDAHQVLKQPALDAAGYPLPPKPRVSKARSEQADSPAATTEKE